MFFLKPFASPAVKGFSFAFRLLSNICQIFCPIGISMATQKEDTCSVVTSFAQPILESLGLELVDIEFGRVSGSNAVLRLFIDKDGGVTLDDCAGVSRELSLILDVEDVIACNYTLEVSSPGLDRPLKKQADYDRFAGRLIKVRTYQPFLDDSGNKRKTFLGKLEGLVDGIVKMTLNEGQSASIPIERIAKANLEFEL
jgi:ribosome maturation factor RimP